MTICNNESKANALAPKHYNAELGRAIKGLLSVWMLLHVISQWTFEHRISYLQF